MNIFLIGYRCTGKTSVGRLLAERLQRDFLDSDNEVVKHAGKSIKEIVQNEGWKAFRELEHKVIARISGFEYQVVATGGGVILDERNVAAMKNNGTLIWLEASTETIEKRILEDQTTGDYRPSLTKKGTVSEIRDTLKERTPYYTRAMDFSVNTDNRSITEVAEIITNELMKRGRL